MLPQKKCAVYTTLDLGDYHPSISKAMMHLWRDIDAHSGKLAGLKTGP